MNVNGTAALDQIKRKPAVAGLRDEANADRKALAEQCRTLLGRAIERALVLANLTKQDASFRMGYPDQSAISRWIGGVENPQLHKLLAIDELRPWLAVALAEVSGSEVETTVRVRRVGGLR